MRLQEWFESVRKWIDGEEDLDEKGQPRPRSKWEDFLVAVAREVEQNMQREMFTPPGGPTYIPREYIVFLSTADDADWQGEKREGLERGLHHVLSERAKELVGNTEFQTKTFTVELRVDATLEAGRFRVQHIWDSGSQKTVVKPRRRDSEAGPGSGSEAATALLAPEKGSGEDRDDEATIVRPRKKDATFQIAVKKSGSTEADVRPVFKNEIAIGRGSRQVAVDLKLEGDMEVSRKHATITKQGDGKYSIACHGANPIVVNGDREVGPGNSAEIKAGDTIGICTYELAIVEKPAEKLSGDTSGQEFELVQT
jgi:hypothetical protein